MSRNNRRRLINFIYRYTRARFPLCRITLDPLRKMYPDINNDVYIVSMFSTNLTELQRELKVKFGMKGYDGSFQINKSPISGEKVLTCGGFTYKND